MTCKVNLRVLGLDVLHQGGLASANVGTADARVCHVQVLFFDVPLNVIHGSIENLVAFGALVDLLA